MPRRKNENVESVILTRPCTASLNLKIIQYYVTTLLCRVVYNQTKQNVDNPRHHVKARVAYVRTNVTVPQLHFSGPGRKINNRPLCEVREFLHLTICFQQKCNNVMTYCFVKYIFFSKITFFLMNNIVDCRRSAHWKNELSSSKK